MALYNTELVDVPKAHCACRARSGLAVRQIFEHHDRESTLAAQLGMIWERGVDKPFQSPAALTLAKEFHVQKATATYIGSAPTILSALAPLFWIPLSRRIGRRPVLLIGPLISMAGAIGVANSHTFAQALACRMVMGFGGPVGLAIAAAAISDLFFQHEKGSRMGFNSLLMVVAPYVGK